MINLHELRRIIRCELGLLSDAWAGYKVRSDAHRKAHRTAREQGWGICYLERDRELAE